MASLNKVFLLGNATRDPAAKVLPSGTQLCEFGLAVNRKFRTADGEDREEVCFVDCTAFGKQSDVLVKYLTRGKPLLVEGRLKMDSWEDKQGGGKRSKLTVIVENFQFVGGRDNADQGEQAPPQRQQHRQPQRSGASGYGERRRPGVVSNPIPESGGIPADDIPFAPPLY